MEIGEDQNLSAHQHTYTGACVAVLENDRDYVSW